MTADRDDLRDRLDELEDRFTVGDTAAVIVTGDDGRDEWPAGIDEGDITTTRTEPSATGDEPLVVEEPAVPFYRPPEYRGGVVVLTAANVADCFDRMPDEIREKERERRIAHDMAIPPVLQQ